MGVPVFFRYQLNAAPAQDYTFGVGVSADYKMFHLAAGLEGDSDNALDNVVIDVSVTPIDNAEALRAPVPGPGEDLACYGSPLLSTTRASLASTWA